MTPFFSYAGRLGLLLLIPVLFLVTACDQMSLPSDIEAYLSGENIGGKSKCPFDKRWGAFEFR